MYYEVFVYNNRSKKRMDEQVFDEIADARKYGYWLLEKTLLTKKTALVEVVYKGKSITGSNKIVTRDWFRIKKSRNIVYYESEDGWIKYILNRDGSLGKKIKG